LLIGIDEYANVERLYGCVNDVTEFAALLRESFGFAGSDVTLLTDASATRNRILDELEALAGRVRRDDAVVVYYSGHGSQVPDVSGDEKDGQDETIVPSDSGRGEGEVHDITDDELHSYIEGIAAKCGFTTFVFDSCHSGSVDRDALLSAEVAAALEDRPRPRAIPPASTPATDPPRLYRADGPEDLLRSATGLIPQGSYLMVGACLDRQTAKETAIDGKARGFLSYHLAQALRDAPGEPFEAVFTRAARQVEGQADDQTPVLEGPLRLTEAAPFSAVPGAAGKDEGNASEPQAPEPPKDDDNGEGEDGLEWDGKFAAAGAVLVVLIFLALVFGIGWLAQWAIDGDPTQAEISLVVIVSLVAVGLALASFGAYIGFLEIRGRAHALRRLVDAIPRPGERGEEVKRAVLSDAVKEVKGIFEALGKMPTARALIAVGGLTLVAATAFAWHVVPDIDEGGEAPVITAQPAPATTKVKGKAFFRVKASGEGLGYQWQRNGRDMVKTPDLPTLFIRPARKKENGDKIAVVVSNANGEAVSDDATLTVKKRRR
jgi:hypothetical protein